MRPMPRRIWTADQLAADLPKLLTIAALSVTLVVTTIARMMLPPDGFVVVVTTALFAFAALASFAAWLVHRRAGTRMTWLDLAGIFTCIGIVVSMMIDPEDAAQFVGGAPRSE